MKNTMNRILAGSAATLLLTGIGALLCVEPASAAVTTPRVTAAASTASPTKVPVHVPVNVCGNTVNVVPLLNPAFGDTCVSA